MKTYTVVIENGVYEKDTLTVKGKNKKHAEEVALKFAKNVIGWHDAEVSCIFVGQYIVTEEDA